jgi:hypothetical protein
MKHSESGDCSPLRRSGQRFGDRTSEAGVILDHRTRNPDPLLMIATDASVSGGNRMHADLNGTRLWFDVDGLALAPDGSEMRQRPMVVLAHGGPGEL